MESNLSQTSIANHFSASHQVPISTHVSFQLNLQQADSTSISGTKRQLDDDTHDLSFGEKDVKDNSVESEAKTFSNQKISVTMESIESGLTQVAGPSKPSASASPTSISLRPPEITMNSFSVKQCVDLWQSSCVVSALFRDARTCKNVPGLVHRYYNKRKIPSSSDAMNSEISIGDSQNGDNAALVSLDDKGNIRLEIEKDKQKIEDGLRKHLSKSDFLKIEVVGQFNLGFIIGKLGNELFLIDQHASDEKFNYERLRDSYTVHAQRLIRYVMCSCTYHLNFHLTLFKPRPLQLDITVQQEMIASEHLELIKYEKYSSKFLPTLTTLHFYSIATEIQDLSFHTILWLHHQKGSCLSLFPSCARLLLAFLI